MKSKLSPLFYYFIFINIFLLILLFSGEIVAYSLDELNETLIQLFTIRLSLKNGTEYLRRLSSVRQIRCLSPNGGVFAVIWNTFDGSVAQDQNNSEANSQNDIEGKFKYYYEFEILLYLSK